MAEFNIFGQVKKEVQEYFQDKVHIAGTQNNENARYLSKDTVNYYFSQWETINLIDLFYNSKFKSGEYDSEGQRKLFLNICRFRSDVAAKQIDLDTKDFLFVPDEGKTEWPAFFANIEFKNWAKETYFGELLNQCVEAFPKYGWVILKKVKNQLEFVPLQTIRNQQDAKSIAEARFFTIEHPDMTLDEMKAMTSWDTSGMDMSFNEKTTVYERYGFAPLSALKKFKGETPAMGDDKIVVDTLSIVALKNAPKKGEAEGNVLFWEEISERPFQEVAWAKQHGRLMGIGEIENQFENQIGANMSFNLFRRQLLWSSKKIFQSPDDTVARNLVRDVKDGDVLQIAPNGNITQVDMGDRAIGDFNAFHAILDKNSDQKSFTYEVATGESLPSGTPFRLGVQLSNAVNSHFDMKREKLGLFFKRVVTKFVVPNFKKENSKEHTLSLFGDEEGFETLKQIMITQNVNEAIKKAILKGKFPDVDQLKQGITQVLEQKKTSFVKIPDGFYNDLPNSITLTITGEEVDVAKKIETLTNVYQSMLQSGDPRAEKVLDRLLSYTGENLDLLAGPRPQTPPQALPSPQQGVPSPFASSLNQPTTPNKTL